MSLNLGPLCSPPQVIPGLDEGLKTMSTGGVRRLYIPGELAFPKGLPAGEWLTMCMLLIDLVGGPVQAMEQQCRAAELGIPRAFLLVAGSTDVCVRSAVCAPPLQTPCPALPCSHTPGHHPACSAAAGRPRVPPSSPVVFDVKLLYIPGISDDEE